MRAQRIGDYRSRSPHRMRDRSPFPGIGERDYSSLQHRQMRSSLSRMRSPPPPRLREREYAPQYGVTRSPRRIRERGYSPQYPDMPSFPSARVQEREYSAQYRREFHDRHLPYVPGSGSRSVSVEPERSRRVLDGERGSDLVGRRDYDSHGRREYDRRPNQNSQENLWKRSHFNEGLSREESASTMYKWRHSLKPVGDYGVGSSRMTYEKDYGKRGISDLGRHGMFLDEKPMPVEKDRVGTFSAYRSGADILQGSTYINGSFSLPVDNRHRHKEEDLKFRDFQAHSDRQPTRDTYKEKDEPFSYTRDASPYMMHPSGIPNDRFSGFYNDNLSRPTCGFNRTGGMPSDFVDCDTLSQPRPYQSYANPELQQNDMKYQQVDPILSEERTRDRTHPKQQQNEPSDPNVPSDEYYDNIGSFREKFAGRDPIRSGRMDPCLARISSTISRSDLRESRPWDQHHSSGEHSNPGQLDSTRHSHVNKQDEDFLVSRNTYRDFGGEIYRESQSLRGGKHYAVERDASPWAYKEKYSSSTMVERNQGFYGYDYNSRGEVMEEELDLHNEEKILERRHLKDRKSSKRNLGNKLSITKKSASKHHVFSDKKVRSTFGDVECTYSSRKPDMACFHYKNSRRSFNAVTSRYSQLSSRNLLRKVGKSQNFPSKDIKKRLKPAPTANSLGDIKKQWRQLPWTCPPVRKLKPDKSLTTHEVDSDENSHDHRGSSPKDMVDIVKTEPPEGSDDFRQLVHNAFLKFIKQLNENPAHRRKYTEQGKVGILKCSICGSKSEEFADTKDLAMHAFGSNLPGLRSQHLGFHRALCLLMGWNSAIGPDDSWGCDALPDAEVLAAKEDLIIWPPVVIVHNSSIENSDPDGRFIVNSEMFMSYLRDEGFGGGNAKVYRGKPANQSILVVILSGTFSGLQEAERLHKFYAENKHGRAELQHGHRAAAQVMIGDNVKDVLYGYLGLAGDLDKLEFETKKRCVVKSKKDIQAIADAPINME